MTRWSTIRAILTSLAVAGLVVAPLARPVMAMPGTPGMAMPAKAATAPPAADAAAHHGHHGAQHHGAHHPGAMLDPSAAAGAAMPDMPCCPKPALDCKDCALMASCFAMSFAPASAERAALPLTSGRALACGNDAQRDSLAPRPPPKPPKA